jgi:class 3 adenylate cyclase
VLVAQHDGCVIPKTRWARAVDGAYIAYQDFGEGPITLVVIHGWISHLEVYWEQPRYAHLMNRLSSQMRVLVFDKRGTGMSDRFASPPDLETRMDDVRAVMDSAGVERAALLGWGTGGPASALFFAASYPERTIGVCTDPQIIDRQAAGYPWGWDDEAFDRDEIEMVEAWGLDERMAEWGFGDRPEDAPPDEDFKRWFGKFARFSATPGAAAAFSRMWFETDVRDILPAVGAPALVFFRKGATGHTSEEHARYLASRLAGARMVGLPGSAVVVWVEDPEPLAAAVESFLASVAEEEADFDRVLATVLFTDIVGSTEQASRLGDRRWKELVEQHHRVVRTLLTRYRGSEIDTAGDGFFASFDGPARAVRCAQAVIEAVQPFGLEIRAGLHTGEIQTIGDKVGGLAVNIGARVGSTAHASEVLVSQTVKDLTAGSGLAFEDAGEHELKGIPDRWRLYRATHAPQRVELRSPTA